MYDTQSPRLQETQMTYYRQTLIIPKPKQQLNAPGRPPRYDARRVGTRNSADRELNSILAFFD